MTAEEATKISNEMRPIYLKEQEEKRLSLMNGEKDYVYSRIGKSAKVGECYLALPSYLNCMEYVLECLRSDGYDVILFEGIIGIIWGDEAQRTEIRNSLVSQIIEKEKKR